ncbi:hypothetical protein [Ornithinibacillus halophilus]|uniref:Uncharacterized protein n=1 Tax=Ornithinibacillus halophilus TaxID=930117 RepID=A0A1M5J5M8_9BACI|nr:hypothetical protein [Ornithinibacillus halophilus]SHG35510.1 hypothetical protein SAMN05216225_10287 [Ornithinibacillus halophilus]
MSVVGLVRKTLPFIFARLAVYALFAVIAFVFLGIVIGISLFLFKTFEFGSGFFILIIIISFFSVIGGLKFFERYALYIVKVGHISVITELLANGKVPDGKGQLAYGKDQVKENFGSANVCFVVDRLVYGAVKQIQRWLMRIGNFFSFVPGSQNIIAIINRILSVSLNYIDEAILSYILLRKKQEKDETVWKSAADGVVLYAQSWKKIIMTAIGVVVFIYVLSFTVFLVSVFPLMGLANMIADNNEAASVFGFFAVVGAFIITSFVKRALVDPVATVAMIRTFQKNIEGVEPSMDLHEKLTGVSKKFKKLADKKDDPEESK